MAKCWQEYPDVRPTFANLTSELKDLENQHKVNSWRIETDEIVCFYFRISRTCLFQQTIKINPCFKTVVETWLIHIVSPDVSSSTTLTVKIKTIVIVYMYIADNTLKGPMIETLQLESRTRFTVAFGVLPDQQRKQRVCWYWLNQVARGFATNHTGQQMQKLNHFDLQSKTALFANQLSVVTL